MKMWRAWFDDGSEYNSSEHSWDLAVIPADGLLVKMLYDRDGPGKEIQHGVDYYYEAPGRRTRHSIVQGCGMDRDEIERRYPEAVIVRGRWAPDEDYQEIMALAHASEAPRGD